jgi:hypothetical protein
MGSVCIILCEESNERTDENEMRFLIGEILVTFPDKETSEDIRRNYRLLKWQVDSQTTEGMVGTS